MAKFCGNCGAQLSDDAVVCYNCGVNIAPQPQQAPAQYQQPQYQQAPYQQPQQAYAGGPTPADNAASAIKEKAGAFVNKCKTDKKFLGIILGAVAAVVAIIVVLVLVLGGGYEAAIDNYIDASLGDYDAYVDCFPEEVFEMMEKYDVAEDEDDFEKQADRMKDYDIDYEIVKEEKVDDDDLDDIKSFLKKNFDIPKSDVKEAIEAKVKLTVSYDGEDRSDTEKLVVVNIDGDWYVLDPLKEIASSLSYAMEDYDTDSDYDYEF